MANYTKATDFAAKDGLTSGDPAKIVKGTEIDDEFNAIVTAVNSKANTNSPTLTGIPAAPTAVAGTSNSQLATTSFVGTAVTNGITTERSATATLTNKTLTNADANTQTFGNNTTKVATTAFVQAALQAVYPVGSIYISTVATNPSTTFGFGTWAAFGDGKVLVGQNTGDASFDTLEETGGSKDATVIAHSHTFSATTGGHSNDHSHSGSTSGAGNHTHTLAYSSGSGTLVNSIGGGANGSITNYGTASMTNPGDHAHSFTTGGTSSNHTHDLSGTTASSGSSGTNANLQPYVVVKMWKRTA